MQFFHILQAGRTQQWEGPPAEAEQKQPLDVFSVSGIQAAKTAVALLRGAAEVRQPQWRVLSVLLEKLYLTYNKIGGGI